MVDATNMPSLKTVARFDVAQPRGTARPDDWGNLHIPAMFVEEGVFPYRRADGKTVREYKPASEIYSERFMASLRSATLCDGHPPYAVTPANAKEYDCGHVKDTVTRTDEGLTGEVVAKSPDLIAKVNSREATQVSVGLDCVIDPSPGTWTDAQGRGHPYDCVQRAMTANHVAIVKKARVPTANLRLDSAEMIVEPTKKVEPMTTQSLMRLDVGDNASVEVPADVGHTIKSYIGTLIKAGKERTEDRDKHQARADAAEEALKEANEKLEKAAEVDVDKLVQERTDCLAGARKLMKTDAVDQLVKDGKSNEDIRKAACLVAKPEFKLDDRNASYIESRFDSLVDAASTQPANKQAAEIAGIVNAPAPELEKTNQQRYDEGIRNLGVAWRGKAS